MLSDWVVGFPNPKLTAHDSLAWRNRNLSDFGLVKKSASPIIMMVNSDTANRMKVGGRLARPPKHQI